MSQQKILDTLQNLGFSSLDAQVYLLIGKKGPKKVSELVHALKIPKQQLYIILKNLQSKGIINATLEYPARFSAEPFEKVLDIFLKTRVEEVQQIQSNMNQIITDWQSIKLSEEQYKPSTFKVLEGKNYISPKLKQMVEEAKTQLSVVLTIPELLEISQNRAFENFFLTLVQSSIKIKILTNISLENAKAFKNVFQKKSERLEIRAPDFGLKLPNSMLIRDEEEVAFLIDSTSDPKKENTCLWTNCKALVQSFNSVFENSWQNSTNIQKKMAEIEKGTPSPKTFMIKNAECAHNKYAETAQLAQKSILILTSSIGLNEQWKKRNQVKIWVKKGVSVKIMAPIVNENLEAARQLMKFCEVKHVPVGYVGATIVDSKHLFQFKNTPLDRKNQNKITSFENTFYTNDVEYINKMENMLNDIWKNVQTPSPIVLKNAIQQSISLNKLTNENIIDEYKNEYKKILGFNYLNEPQQGKLTEKKLIRKIATAKRIPAKDPKRDVIRLYGTMGSAIIYPTKNLNLPNFIIQVYHCNNQSSFGAENSLFFFVEANIADQQSYIPAAFITDNPQALKFRTAMKKDQHTTEVSQLLKRDELKVQVSSDKLFVGWTVPIPLLPPKYVLSPACIMFEGYGKIRSFTSERIGAFKRRITYEYNTLDAFVTFVHQSSQYNGPGSDALLHRDIAIVSYPLSNFQEANISTK